MKARVDPQSGYLPTEVHGITPHNIAILKDLTLKESFWLYFMFKVCLFSYISWIIILCKQHDDDDDDEPFYSISPLH
jgi:hypothetical protein